MQEPAPTQTGPNKNRWTVSIKAIVFDAYGTLYDIQSVADVTEEAFPGYGEIITQVWRIKQLEYTWLRSLMRRYENFSVVTRDSLAYTLRTLGLDYDAATFALIMDKYLHLDSYPEAHKALAALAGRLAILSNGSASMLEALVRNSGLERCFEAVISVNAARTYKPHPSCYALVEQRLGVGKEEVLFVSSNGFDVTGAKAFGFNVAWIRRGGAGAATLYGMLRGRAEELGHAPDHVVSSLTELPKLL